MDILPLLQAAIKGTVVSLALIYGGVIAESDVNQYAEHWGKRTTEAIGYLNSDNLDALQELIDEIGPGDISFSYGQRVIPYHYYLPREATVGDILSIRERVFADPAKDLRMMAIYLDWCLTQANKADLRRVKGDPELGALVCYNAGHYPAEDAAWYWGGWNANVNRYQAALHRARTELPFTSVLGMPFP